MSTDGIGAVAIRGCMSDDGFGTVTRRSGVWKPQQHLSAHNALTNPYAFAVGELVTYVQAPKAKGHRSRVLSAFQLPDHGL